MNRSLINNFSFLAKNQNGIVSTDTDYWQLKPSSSMAILKGFQVHILYGHGFLGNDRLPINR